MITEAEYAQALAEMRRLVEAEPDRRSVEGLCLAALAALADTYEAHKSGQAPADFGNR